MRSCTRPARAERAASRRSRETTRSYPLPSARGETELEAPPSAEQIAREDHLGKRVEGQGHAGPHYSGPARRRPSPRPTSPTRGPPDELVRDARAAIARPGATGSAACRCRRRRRARRATHRVALRAPRRPVLAHRAVCDVLAQLAGTVGDRTGRAPGATAARQPGRSTGRTFDLERAVERGQRRAIPRRPVPRSGSAPPVPSSVTVLRNASPSGARSISAERAPLCLITFASASAIAKYAADSTGAGLRPSSASVTRTGIGARQGESLEPPRPVRDRRGRADGSPARGRADRTARCRPGARLGRAAPAPARGRCRSAPRPSPGSYRAPPAGPARRHAGHARSGASSAAWVSTVSARESVSCWTRCASRLFSDSASNAQSRRACTVAAIAGGGAPEDQVEDALDERDDRQDQSDRPVHQQPDHVATHRWVDHERADARHQAARRLAQVGELIVRPMSAPEYLRRWSASTRVRPIVTTRIGMPTRVRGRGRHRRGSRRRSRAWRSARPEGREGRQQHGDATTNEIGTAPS